MRALNRATVKAIRFNTSGWIHSTDSTLLEAKWMRDQNESLLVATMHNRPCNPALEREALFRDIAHMSANPEEGGLISADSIALRSGRAARCITKIPQRCGGITYQGILVIPFKSCHITILLRCEQRKDFGFREAAVYTELSAMERTVDNWHEGTDRLNSHGLSRNVSEDEQWDKYFPDHPLTRVRSYLRQIERTFTYNARLLDSLCDSKTPWWSSLQQVAMTAMF